MDSCCDSGSETAKKQQKQNLTKKPRGSGWFSKVKVAFGFDTKADFIAKKDADEK